MKKVNERQQPFSKVSSYLLCEILGRVPIKTCLTCKLVCKEWYHIIVGPDFSSFRRQCNVSRFTLLIFGGCRTLNGGGGVVFNLVEIDKALDVDDSRKYVADVDHLVRIHPKIDRSVQICYARSHCKGVVHLISTNLDYFVCNLLTGQHVKLENVHELRNQYPNASGCEVGCCPVSGQFKVLFVLWDAVNKIQLAKIQTLGSSEWRNVGNTPLKIKVVGCFLNGSSHWLDQKCIWSFHFGEEKFSKLPLPDDVNVESYGKVEKSLSVLESCLCLGCFVRSGGSGGMEIWIMKEYGVKESWVKQRVVGKRVEVPLMLMDDGKILERKRGEIYLYDPQTEAFKKVKFELDGLSYCSLPPTVFDASFSRF